MSTIGALLAVLLLSLLSVGRSKYIPLDCNDSDTICVEANGFLRCATNEQGRKITINGEVEYCPPNSECQDSVDEVCVSANISKSSNISTGFHLQQLSVGSEVVENEFTTTENSSTGYTESSLIGDIQETDSNSSSKEALTHVRNTENNSTSLLQEILLEQPSRGNSQDNENTNNSESAAFLYSTDTNATLFYQEGLNNTNSKNPEDLLGYSGNISQNSDFTETSQTENLKNHSDYISNPNPQIKQDYSNQSLGNESYPLSEDMYLNLSSKGESVRKQVNESSGDYEYKPSLVEINSINETAEDRNMSRDVEMGSFQTSLQETSNPETETQFEIMQLGNREQIALDNNSKSAIISVELQSVDKEILIESGQHDQNESFTDFISTNTSESSSTLHQAMQSSQQENSQSDIDVSLDTSAKTESRLERSNLTGIEVVDKTVQSNQNMSLKTDNETITSGAAIEVGTNKHYFESKEASIKDRESNREPSLSSEMEKPHTNYIVPPNITANGIESVNITNNLADENTETFKLEAQDKIRISHTVNFTNTESTKEADKRGDTHLNDTLQNQSNSNHLEMESTNHIILSNGMTWSTVSSLSYQNETNDHSDIQKLVNTIGIGIQSENNESVPSVGHGDKVTNQSNGVVQKPDPRGENEDQQTHSSQNFHSINQDNPRMNPRLQQENNTNATNSLGDPLHKIFEGHRVDDSTSITNSSRSDGGGATERTHLPTDLALNISTEPVDTQSRPFPHQSNSERVSSVKREKIWVLSLGSQKEHNASVAENNFNYTLSINTETTPRTSFQDDVPQNYAHNQYPKIGDEGSFKKTPTDMKVSIDRSSDNDVNDSGDTDEQNSDDYNHSGDKKVSKVSNLSFNTDSSKEENESTESKELETSSNFRKLQDSEESDESTDSVLRKNFHCYEEGTFGHLRDSRKFFVCSRRSENGELKMKEYKCPKFRVFDSVSLKCVGMFSAKCV